MTPIINFSNAFSVIVALVLFILVMLLGRESKKSIVPGIMLVVFLMVLTGHAFEYSIATVPEIQTQLAISLAVDFAFIFVSFLSYLWIDEMESKSKKKKSIDSSLNWLWKKV